LIETESLQVNRENIQKTTSLILKLHVTGSNTAFLQAEVEKREGFRLGKVTEAVLKKKKAWSKGPYAGVDYVSRLIS
jgi:hypothetical protein